MVTRESSHGGRRILRSLLSAVLLAAVVPLLAAPGASGDPGSLLPGQRVMVVLEDDASLEVSLALLAERGVVPVDVWREAVVGFVADLADDDVIALTELGGVVSVERDRPMSLSGWTVDQAAPPWGLDRIDQRQRPLDGRYRALRHGAGVLIYVVDTGINTQHVDLAGRIAPGAAIDFGDGRGIEDCHGHGTHVAATAAGATYGVAKGATIVPVKIMSCDGVADASWLVGALDWIVATHPQGVPGVVNLSLGGEALAAIDAAVAAVVSSGLTVVAAAGNDAVDACTTSPARVSAAITVGATTSTDAIAGYSNRGPCLDVFAPGSSVLSAWIGSPTATSTRSGTSMAAPHVAGAAALVLEQHPAADPEQVWATLAAAATSGVLTGRAAAEPDRLLFVDPELNSLPGPPVSVVAVPGNLRATVSWTAPLHQGDPPLTGYRVVASPGGASCEVVATTCVVAGLTHGTPHTFSVSALSELGEGPPSLPSDPVVPTHGFLDVRPGAFYDTPVAWLAASDITTGVGGNPTVFAPEAPVTRGQMAAFLWRLVGRPEPLAGHGFTDVPVGVSFDAAVAWLVEQGITTGYGGSSIRFAPEAPVTRAQMAAFLWRLVGRPEPLAGHGFTDVPAGAYFDTAVAWLVERRITTGYGGSGTRFAPELVVTRGQMAAFLHRLAPSLP
jgi:subtilisin family serine protease